MIIRSCNHASRLHKMSRANYRHDKCWDTRLDPYSSYSFRKKISPLLSPSFKHHCLRRTCTRRGFVEPTPPVLARHFLLPLSLLVLHR